MPLMEVGIEGVNHHDHDLVRLREDAVVSRVVIHRALV